LALILAGDPTAKANKAQNTAELLGRIFLIYHEEKAFAGVWL
jgi:hypothetical protein